MLSDWEGVINLEHISHLFIVFLLLTLNKEMSARNLLEKHE